jgi:hypothetical protein
MTTASMNGSASSTSSTPAATTPQYLWRNKTKRGSSTATETNYAANTPPTSSAAKPLHSIDRHRYQPFFLSFSPTVPHARLRIPRPRPLRRCNPGPMTPKTTPPSWSPAWGRLRRPHPRRTRRTPFSITTPSSSSPPTTEASSTSPPSKPWAPSATAKAPPTTAAPASP